MWDAVSKLRLFSLHFDAKVSLSVSYIVGIPTENATQCQFCSKKDIFFGFFPVFFKRLWHIIIPRIFLSIYGV